MPNHYVGELLRTIGMSGPSRFGPGRESSAPNRSRKRGIALLDFKPSKLAR